jgi:hypothetical protein
LQDRIFHAVQVLLSVGDRGYLRRLSRAAFLDALEQELRFFGVYASSDADITTCIRVFLEQHVDQWQLDIAYIQEDIFSASQSLQERRVELPSSPLLHMIDNASPVLSIRKTTHFFSPILPSTSIQHGSHTSEGIRG